MENQDHQEYLDQEAIMVKMVYLVLKDPLDHQVMMVKEEDQDLLDQGAFKYDSH